MYENEIKTLEFKVEMVNSKLDIALKGSPEFIELTKERNTLIDKLRVLRKKQWDETYERINMDDDR